MREGFAFVNGDEVTRRKTMNFSDIKIPIADLMLSTCSKIVQSPSIEPWTRMKFLLLRNSWESQWESCSSDAE